jgi:uncharacterized protein
VTGTLRLRVQPGAKRTGLVGWMADGTLKVSVSAPPEDGRANRAVVELMAAALGVREATVRVVRGHAARTKTVEVDGADDETLRRRITAGMERGADAAGRARHGPRRGGGTHDGQ